jgi:sulfate adenylyltransferase (ADP) / ATP adenylyltransferase
VPFVVRSVSSLERKRLEAGRVEQAEGGRARNPLMPPEPPLTVGDLTATHVGVLNKYPVVAHHLLVVTKAPVPQEAALDRDDFLAIARCLAEIDGLAFYNGGREAGASQPHKHLQLVPLPIDRGLWAAPIEAVFDSWAATGNVSRLLRLPFRNAFSLLDGFDNEQRAAERLEELYAEQLAAIGVVDGDGPRAANDEALRPAPYNLLVTRRWMLAVPRSRERFGTISINALGFAGSLFVRDEEELQDLREAGPMRALRAVSAV